MPWTNDAGDQLYAQPDCRDCRGSGYDWGGDDSCPCACDRLTRAEWIKRGYTDDQLRG